jgi:hypothetical protein
MRFSIFICVFILFALFFSCAKKPSQQNYFPDTGKNALYQRSLDTRSNLHVLSIALQPGYEDLAALAYFRVGRGAAIKSAYVTNGEAGESDVQGEYPPYLADIRRKEAARALAYLDGEAYFLNMSDIAAARDTTKVRLSWPGDTLQSRLTRLISQFKPEVIILARDWAVAGTSARGKVLYDDLLSAVQQLATAGTATKSTNHSFPARVVDRVFVDNGRGLRVPTTESHPRWKKSYQAIGEEAANAYASLKTQRRLWLQAGEPSYQLIYPDNAPSIGMMEEGLPLPVTPRLRRMEEEIRQLTAITLAGKTGGTMKKLVAVMDSIDYTLALRSDLPARERKTLLHWKKGLESLRCAMLGVQVDYTVSDTLLTGRQLTYLTIDEVKGLAAEGKTDIYFAGLQPDWGINEDVTPRLPLELRTEYRLLSPQDLDYNFPPGSFQITSPTVGRSFYFFIIHRPASKEQSFVHRTTINLAYAPKLAVEVLTPIVRMAQGERVVVRLTNISRDGLADTLGIQDPLAFARGRRLRLSTKGAISLDTLFIAWEGHPDDGSYLLPIQIGGAPVAQFAARKFRADIAAGKRLGVITGIRNSPTAEALRRLNAPFSTIASAPSLVQQIGALDVLIIDRRALTFKPEIADQREALNQLVNKGGHLIVLAQEAATWNAKPLWEGMRLTPTLEWDENFPIWMEPAHPLAAAPNPIAPEDWNDWLFLRAHNVVSGPALSAASLPIKAAHTGSPLVVSFNEGKGRKTYVDLALQPQLMNVHAGAFRLLANLISY